LSKIEIRRKTLLTNQSKLLEQSTQMVSQIANSLNTSFNLSSTPWKEYELRTLKLSTSPNIPRVGGMLTVVETSKIIGLLQILKI